MTTVRRLISTEDGRQTVLSALEDAADYRREYIDGTCYDCHRNGYDPAKPDPNLLCDDHAVDEAMASMYDQLHGQLQQSRPKIRRPRPRSRMSRVPEPARAANSADWQAIRREGILHALLCYIGPAGWWTQWYWPEGTRGKVWNLFHGKGWRIA